MRSLIASVLVFVLSAPALAAAPVPEQVAGAIRSRCQERGISPEIQRQLLRPVQRAAEAGLPAESVGDKVLEGLAKGVDPARITAAADDLAKRLTSANAAFHEAGVKLPHAEQRIHLERLALALQGADSSEALELARASRGASADSLCAATRQLGAVRGRGIPGVDAIPALAALARAGYPSDQIGRVAAMLDEYRAEGGEEPRAFFDEVRSRAEKRRDLKDLVNPFGDRPDPLNRTLRKPAKDEGRPGVEPKPGHANPSGQPSLEKPGRSGSAPGLDIESSARKQKNCVPGSKGKPYCK